jgi:hypothetical protein
VQKLALAHCNVHGTDACFAMDRSCQIACETTLSGEREAYTGQVPLLCFYIDARGGDHVTGMRMLLELHGFRVWLLRLMWITGQGYEPAHLSHSAESASGIWNINRAAG